MKDEFTRTWIIQNALEEIKNYEKGILTLRGLHYRLVSRGMTNSLRHYKRVVQGLIQARWDGLVAFDTFSDHDRSMLGDTENEETVLDDKIETAKEQVKLWVTNYRKNKWENQKYYPEVFIEKKALQGVFQSVCFQKDVALGACKGYPSLTFLNDASKRFKAASANGQQPIILYFGDYDPSGEDIPRSIKENLQNLGCRDIEVKRIALMEDQVVEWQLPPAPAKLTDSRTAKWDGLGQVELDAVEPNQLQELCRSAIDSVFDFSALNDLREVEEEERQQYQHELKLYVQNLEL